MFFITVRVVHDTITFIPTQSIQKMSCHTLRGGLWSQNESVEITNFDISKYENKIHVN